MRALLLALALLPVFASAQTSATERAMSWGRSIWGEVSSELKPLEKRARKALSDADLQGGARLVQQFWVARDAIAWDCVTPDLVRTLTGVPVPDWRTEPWYRQLQSFWSTAQGWVNQVRK